MGRVDTDGRVARHFASRQIFRRARSILFELRYAPRVGLPAETSQSSATAIPLRGAVVSAARQRVTHILDWFHMSMRVRHIEQAFEGILQFEPELKSWLLTSAYCDVPRLRHLLCSGYVDETRDALRLMSGLLLLRP